VRRLWPRRRDAVDEVVHAIGQLTAAVEDALAVAEEIRDDQRGIREDLGHVWDTLRGIHEAVDQLGDPHGGAQ
jgi:hypothetical protein